MNDDKKAQLKTVAEMLREERRKYNIKLKLLAEGTSTEYNGEDLVRLVGSLEAAYNHCLASIASDGDIFCLLKHVSYSLVLAGEMDVPEVENLYDIMTVISDGRIEPCSSCRREETTDEDRQQQIEG